MKAKYERWKQIVSVGSFEISGAEFYRVKFGSGERTVHRSFLISWQYNTLYNFIHQGLVYEARLIDKEKKKPSVPYEMPSIRSLVYDFEGTVKYLQEHGTDTDKLTFWLPESGFNGPMTAKEAYDVLKKHFEIYND